MHIQEIKEILSTISTCVISDILDGIGVRGVLSHQLVPLNDQSHFIGQAITVQWEYVRKGQNIKEPGMSTWDEVKNFLIDSNVDAAGKIYVSGFGPLLPEMALAGGLSLTYFQNIGIEGMVLGGGMRDAEVVKRARIPVFAPGFTPADTQGCTKIADSKGYCIIDNIKINDGDIVKGDDSGIVVIPQNRLDEVLAIIPSVRKKEEQVMAALESGEMLPDIIEKFKWI